MLEAAAEQLQAALLASIDEESSTKQQVKGKRKGGKKGKRSKKNGPSPPAEPSIQAAADEEQEQEEGTSIDPPKDQGPAQAGPSGQLDSAQSDAESDATVFDDRGQPAAAPAPAVSSTGGAPEQQRSQSEARGGTSEDEAEWKVQASSLPVLHLNILGHLHRTYQDVSQQAREHKLGMMEGCVYLQGGGQVNTQAQQ